MKATEQLKSEHEGIGIMLRVVNTICSRLESDGSFDDRQFERIIEFFRVFVDRCHHGKEEDMLFPAMKQAGIPDQGGPIGQMLAEHEQGRTYVRKMEEPLKRCQSGSVQADSEICMHARAYTALMTQHIDKENTILFPLADRVLSAERQAELFDAFEKLEDERIGKGVHEQFHELLNALARRYLEDQQS